MSMEAAKAFVEKMKTDKDFAKEVTSCKDVESRKKYVNDAGFSFTKEDLELVKLELSDEDVESLAGGTSGNGYHCTHDSHCHNRG